MELLVGLGALLVAGAMFSYKKWGAKYLKKWLDDPATPEDESAIFVDLGEKALKLAAEAAVARAIAEAKKNSKVNVAEAAAADLIGKFAGHISLEDAKKLVDAALKVK